MKKALYPGTFDPITLGHIDIISRALHLFDEITIAIATSETKTPLFPVEERIRQIELIFKGNEQVRTIGFTGLVVDLAKQEGVNVLIRGLRAVSDFEYEFQLANMNRAMSPDLESVFLTPKASKCSSGSHIPAVSTRQTGTPASSNQASTVSRVVPGTDDVIALLCPKIALNKLDLPEFGFP